MRKADLTIAIQLDPPWTSFANPFVTQEARKVQDGFYVALTKLQSGSPSSKPYSFVFSLEAFSRMNAQSPAHSPGCGAIVRERYANHILWMAVWRIILTVWDSTRKTIWRGGVVLYRSR
jgi:hypothetical protein